MRNMQRRLHGPIDVELVNSNFFPEDIANVSLINHGRCFLWAYICFRLFNEAELWSMGAHAFVRSSLDRKFYDAERIKGEDDWRDLPATNFGRGCGCHDCRTGATKHASMKSFQERWHGMAERYNVNWKMVNLKIKRFIEDNQ